MFRIRRVPDDTTETNALAIRQVQDILRTQFPLIDEAEVQAFPAKLRDPMRHGFRALLFVAEGSQDRVRGFALLLHAADLDFCFLDYIAMTPGRVGGGLGGALYERVRDTAASFGAVGVFLECLPDDPALCRDPEVRKRNADRLRFYERFGARPIANTAYATPLKPDQDNPPYLVFDSLGRSELPGRDRARVLVRAILERKYGRICPPGYIDRVVDSIQDDPIALRPPRYIRRETPRAAALSRAGVARIPLVVNDKHRIHYVRDRGYVEAPVRIRAIMREFERLDMFERVEPRHFPESLIRAVHDGRFVDFLQRACMQVEAGRSIYPYVFPIRNQARAPKELPLRAGYFCIDTFTPLNREAYVAARGAVDCALTAAERVLEGGRFAYALVRPPGHHAERRVFGGFCYFNNAAIAANYLSRYGRVAVLDVDYHHGNGTQDIFYHRSDVLTVSIHGHPSFAYPYFSGWRDEKGTGPGTGYNLNIPLPETITPERYREALATALGRVGRFGPAFLVLSLGLDTAAGDPTGSWPNRGPEFAAIGAAIAAAGYPTVVVQEGGYRTRTLGGNARRFFEGLWQQAAETPLRDPSARRPAAAAGAVAAPTTWRDEIRDGDVEWVRSAVAANPAFTNEDAGRAVELLVQQFSISVPSGNSWLFAERGERVVGFAGYGPLPGTDRRFRLHWIAVHPDQAGQGLGRELLARAEAAAAAQGAVRLYAEALTGESHRQTRAFFRRAGYQKAAELPDYYLAGQGSAIYVKDLVPARD
ncbi:MAG: GNAT family N-acetyltransferase [Dongiaceae bacterium]